MLDAMKLEVLANAMRAHWQLGGMDNWFCKYCGVSFGCETAVEVMACDTNGDLVGSAGSSVMCGDCFDTKWKGEVLSRMDKLPANRVPWVLDGRRVDWSCPGLSPKSAFVPLWTLADEPWRPCLDDDCFCHLGPDHGVGVEHFGGNHIAYNAWVERHTGEAPARCDATVDLFTGEVGA